MTIDGLKKERERKHSTQNFCAEDTARYNWGAVVDKLIPVLQEL